MPQAEKDLQAYLAQKPKDDGALSALARIKFANADYAAAESIIRQAIQVAPDRVEYRDALGMTLEAQNKVNEAIAEYREALRRQANDPVAGNNLAWLLVENGGNLEEALKLAQMAKERSPENPAISDTLGWIYLKKNVPGTAISEFKNALQREPNNPMFNYHLGLAYKQTGDNNLAAKYIQLALDSKQPFPAQEKAQALLRSLK
jgi:Flp pilus assembly protein TadD